MRGISLITRMASPRKVSGAFTVELALVATVLSLLLSFTGDIVVKLSMRGKLDRLSFSAVSIIKERTQLYANVDELTQQDVDRVFSLLSDSLARTTGNYQSNRFSGLVEEQLYDGTTALASNQFVPSGAASSSCRPTQSLAQIRDQVGVVTSWGRNARLYRITLCYETGSWFGQVIGSDQFRHVSSSAVIIGR